MKKLILTSIILLFGVCYMNAQINSDEVQWGAKAGANFSSVTGDDVKKAKSIVDFNIGLLAEVPLSEQISLQPEVLYSRQGFKISENDFGKATYNLDYIQVPVLVKVYLAEGLNIHAGPQIGFNIHEDMDIETDWGDVNIDTEDSDVKDISFDVAAGLEYKFDGGFFVNARYNYGITKLADDFDAHNSVFQIGGGFMF